MAGDYLAFGVTFSTVNRQRTGESTPAVMANQFGRMNARPAAASMPWPARLLHPGRMNAPPAVIGFQAQAVLQGRH